MCEKLIFFYFKTLGITSKNEVDDIIRIGFLYIFSI